MVNVHCDRAVGTGLHDTAVVSLASVMGYQQAGNVFVVFHFRYQPSQEVQSPPNGHHPLSVSSRNSPKPAKSYLKSTRNGQTTKTPYDVLAPGSDDEYDYPTNSNSNNRSVYASNQIKVCSEHAQNLTQGRSLPPTPDSPPKTGRFKHHTYEPLLPKEDVDTYVYMAPLSDYPELLQQESVQTRSRGSSHSPRTSDSHRSVRSLTSLPYMYTGALQMDFHSCLHM